MKSLSKHEVERRDGYAEELRELRGKIEDQFRVLNEETFKPINDLIDEYNELAEEARGFVEDLGRAMSDYFDERSEKWQEGDKGQSYRGWIDTYESFEVEELAHVEIPDTTEEDANVPEALEALPVEPEE